MMSRRSVARPPSGRDVTHDPEAIALRIHQIARAAGAIAEGQEEPLSHAIYLIEECLLEVEPRVEALRHRMAPA